MTRSVRASITWADHPPTRSRLPSGVMTTLHGVSSSCADATMPPVEVSTTVISLLVAHTTKRRVPSGASAKSIDAAERKRLDQRTGREVDDADAVHRNLPRDRTRNVARVGDRRRIG